LPVRAGLGDNVVGMLSLWGYAVATKRLFLVRIVSPHPFGRMVSESTKHEFVYNEKEDSKFGPLVEEHRIVHNIMRAYTINLLKGPAKVAALHVAGSESPHKFALRNVSYYSGKIPEFSERVKSAITKILLDPSEELLKLKARFLSSNALDYGKPYFAYHARLGSGLGEKGNPRFANISYTEISECAAEKLLRIAQKYGIKSRELCIFLATDTAAFRIVFEKAMSKKAPHSRVVHMKNPPKHFKNTRDHRGQLRIQLENIILGDAKEIIAFWSGFSLVAQGRGQSKKLHEMFYNSCPRMDRRAIPELPRNTLQE